MHITLFVYGSWGDLRPYVVLGKGLKEAGYDVQIAATREYEDWIRERNLGFFPLEANMGDIIKHGNEVGNPLQGLKYLREFVKPALIQMGMDMNEAMKKSDVLITIQFGISLLHGIMRANNFKTIVVDPANLTSTGESSTVFPPPPDWFPFPKWYNRSSFGMLQRISWMTTSGARKDLNKKLGLPESKYKDFQALVRELPAITTVSPHVFQRPSDWEDKHQVTGYLFDDDPNWTPPQDLIDFIAAGSAPIYIGFGSMPDNKPQETTRKIIKAVQQTGQRAIILKGWSGLGVDNVSENIYMLNYASHHWLFPKMSAVIHHGGAGTTAAGFRAGVPMTIVPHNGDQPYWGRVVKDIGVGTAPISKGKLKVDNLAQAIQTLTTDNSLRENAKKLSQKIQAEDGLTATVQAINYILKK